MIYEIMIHNDDLFDTQVANSKITWKKIDWSTPVVFFFNV